MYCPLERQYFTKYSALILMEENPSIIILAKMKNPTITGVSITIVYSFSLKLLKEIDIAGNYLPLSLVVTMGF